MGGISLAHRRAGFVLNGSLTAPRRENNFDTVLNHAVGELAMKLH
jgi:hypothetical protein